jgi:CO dehydrogenase/acetyl-CoA synthase beta subunit
MSTHKGSWSRVKDTKSYQDNYEEIFRKKQYAGPDSCCGCLGKLTYSVNRQNGIGFTNGMRCSNCGRTWEILKQSI